MTNKVNTVDVKKITTEMKKIPMGDKIKMLEEMGDFFAGVSSQQLSNKWDAVASAIRMIHSSDDAKFRCWLICASFYLECPVSSVLNHSFVRQNTKEKKVFSVSL